MSKVEKLSKTELSDGLCDLLDIEVDFTKMTKGDLVRLHKRVSELNELMEDIDEKFLGRPLEEILDIRIAGKPLREHSLGEIMRRVRDRGPLGLGIWPEIRQELRRLFRGEKKKS